MHSADEYLLADISVRGAQMRRAFDFDVAPGCASAIAFVVCALTLGPLADRFGVLVAFIPGATLAVITAHKVREKRRAPLRTAISTLVKSENTRDAITLVELLAISDLELRMQIEGALKRLLPLVVPDDFALLTPGQRDRVRVMARLADSDSLRIAAITGLARYKDVQSVLVMQTIVRTTESTSVRAAAKGALSILGDEAASAATLLRASSASVDTRALLRQAGDNASIPGELLRQSSDEESTKR